MTMTKRRPTRSSRSSREVLAAVRPIADRLATVHGLVLWDVSFVRVAGRETLRVSCDRVGGVGSDDLALYTEDLSRELDHTDAVPGDAPYTLDVSSPGAERRLHSPEHFRVCRGRLVHITFGDGRAPVDGTIGDLSDGSVEIETADGTVLVRFTEISRAELRIPRTG